MRSRNQINRKKQKHLTARVWRNARTTAFETLESRLYLSGAEIHGIAYYGQALDPQPLAGIKVFLDDDADLTWDDGELWTVTDEDGGYAITGLAPGTYRVTEVTPRGYSLLDPASGFHSVTVIADQVEEDVDFVHANQPTMVDMFILVDDTGSFDDPGFTADFLTIVSGLMDDLAGSGGAYPEISWAFGVGRYEEYGGHYGEDPPGRPFTLSQPIIEYGSVWTDGQATVTFDEAIQAAVGRRTPGFGGDAPESLVEALYQVATGEGFDGDGDTPRDTTESGPAGPYATQVFPGSSGDVPAFETFEADPDNDIIPPVGSLGGVGFREGAMHVVLVATDAGIRYEAELPPLEPDDFIYGLDGVAVRYGRFTTDGVEGTPRGEGAQIQETVTALNDIEILVIGIGKSEHHDPEQEPRTALEAFAEATGAVYHGAGTLENGTNAPIEPGDPLYFNRDAASGYTLGQGLLAGLSSQVTSVPGVIEGTVWNDTNGNGVWEPGESSMGPGLTVWFDWNENGTLDASEHETTTNANGQYAFGNLVPGQYHIGVGLPAGYDLTTTDHVTVRLGNGSHRVIDIGTHESTAEDDTLLTDEDELLEISISTLTANDLAAVPSTEAPVSFYDFSQPQHGTLVLVEPEGPALLYTPDEDYYGPDTFTYSLTDGLGYYDWATVTITVNPVNDAPRFHAQLRTLESEPVSGQLAYDVEGDPIQVFLRKGADHAVGLQVNSDGTFAYAPEPGWHGVDRFYVSATDGQDWSSWEEITVYVSTMTDDLLPPETWPPAERLGEGAPAGSHRGSAVDASGDLVILGQSLGQSDMGANVLILRDTGSTIMRADGSPAWQTVATLDSGAGNDFFGCSVAIAGNVAVVGAKGDDQRADNAGAAYIWRDSGAGWEQVAKLMAPAGDASAGDLFGSSVAIDAQTGTIVVGAPYSDGSAGAAYIWEFNAGTSQWDYVAKITAQSPQQFGSAVDIDGERIAVGAQQDSGTGAAYLFERQTGGWTQVQKLVGSESSWDARFGAAVALEGDTLVVGAPGEDFWQMGAVYVFTLDGQWAQSARITRGASATMFDMFGASVDLLGDQILVGAPQLEIVPSPGAAFLINKNDVQGDWVTYSVEAQYENVGAAVALSPWGALVGAPYADSESGAAYLFPTPYNRTPVVDDLEFAAGTAPIEGELFGLDPFEQSDLAFWLWDGQEWVNSGPISTLGGTVVFDSVLGSFTYTANSGYSGVDSFTYKANDGLADSNIGTVTIRVNTAPIVIGVSVGYGTHEEHVPAVADGADQIKVENLPFREGITCVSITFDQDVIVSLGDLAVTAGRRLYPTYPLFEWWDVTLYGFDYDDQTHTATWSFDNPATSTTVETITRALVVLALSDSVTRRINPALHLDGEWENPVSYTDNSGNSTFPSGNGVSGGDFVFHFAVPGSADFDLDGFVYWSDYAILMAHMNQGPGMLWSEGDASGDGWVTYKWDYAAWGQQMNTDLRTWPAGLPPGPESLPPMGLSLSMVAAQSAAIEQYLAEESAGVDQTKLRRLLDELFDALGLDMDTAA